MGNKNHLPDLLLEQYHLGELSPEKRREIAGSEDLGPRLSSLAYSDQQILADYPPAEMAEKISGALEDSPATRRKHIIPGRFFPGARTGMLLAAATIMLAIGIPLFLQKTSPAPAATERIKGAGPQMFIYRQEGGETEKLGNHSPVKTNDQLQLAFNPAGKKYGAIISIDGRGTVTPHFPVYLYETTALNAEGTQLINYSYYLDDAPEYERFFFIASDVHFELQDILEAAQKQLTRRNQVTQLDLSEIFGKDEYSQVVITLDKE